MHALMWSPSSLSTLDVQGPCKGPTPIDNSPPFPVANPTHQTLQARDVNDVNCSFRRIILDVKAFHLRHRMVKNASPDRRQNNRGALIDPKISACCGELNQVNVLKLTKERLEFVFWPTASLTCVLVNEHLILECLILVHMNQLKT
jgi:hypothetical protein